MTQTFEPGIPHSSEVQSENLERSHEKSPKQQNKKDAKNHNCYWRRRYDTLRTQHLKLLGKNQRLQRNIEKVSSNKKDEIPNETSIVQTNNLPRAVLEFFETQIRYFSKKKKGMRWTDEEIRFAMSIHYASAAAYQLLRTTFGLHPSVSCTLM